MATLLILLFATVSTLRVLLAHLAGAGPTSIVVAGPAGRRPDHGDAGASPRGSGTEARRAARHSHRRRRAGGHGWGLGRRGPVRREFPVAVAQQHSADVRAA